MVKTPRNRPTHSTRPRVGKADARAGRAESPGEGTDIVSRRADPPTRASPVESAMTWVRR